MDKELEMKIACYLCRTIDYAQYAKMAEWMGKDQIKFNAWVNEKGNTNH